MWVYRICFTKTSLTTNSFFFFFMNLPISFPCFL